MVVSNTPERDATSIHSVIDLRSDAVTRPTAAMWRAMQEAHLGWAPAGDDPSVNELESYAAELVGKEAALFVPTGTMANLLALMTHTERGDQIVLEADSHILWSEEWSFGYICGLVPCVIQGNSGHVSPEAIKRKLSTQRFSHKPRTSLICLENTHNVAGGAVIRGTEISAICGVAREHGISVHLDGARIFNACIATNEDVKVVVSEVDTLMFCLNKGLSAPTGAMLCGPAGFIERSKTNLKRVGGFSIPQAGIPAAAGLVALRTMIPQLSEDNRRAQLLAEGLSNLYSDFISPLPVETNIVMVALQRSRLSARTLLEHLAKRDILGYFCSDDLVRFVMHRHIKDEDICTVIGAFKELKCA